MIFYIKMALIIRYIDLRSDIAVVRTGKRA